MTGKELAQYRELIITPEYGAGRATCWLCGAVFASGETALCVPADCNETEKMQRGAPYDYLLAHRACLMKI